MHHIHAAFYFSVETARILKESAALDAKLEEHIRACSELKQLQVNVSVMSTTRLSRTSLWCA